MKWYVNLPEEPKRNAGPKIPIKVTRSVVSKHDVQRTVTWRCVGEEANLNTVAAHASWTEGDASGTQTSTVHEDGRTRAFHNTLKLPPYGGDKYTISAKRSDRQDVERTETVEVQRKLYYVTNYMNNEGRKLLDLIEPKIARIFGELGIELVRVGRARIKDGPYISREEVKALVDGRPVLPRDKKGLLMRLALVRDFCKTEDYSVHLPVEHGASGSKKSDEDGVEFTNGKWQLTVHLSPQESLPPERQLRFPSNVENVTVTILQFGAISQEKRKSFVSLKTLPSAVERIDDRTIKITIQDANDPVNAVLRELAEKYADGVRTGNFDKEWFDQEPKGKKLKFRVSLKPLRPIGGESGGANIGLAANISFLYPNAGRRDRAAALAGIFAHEIAHSIGMVTSVVDLNGQEVAHRTYYDGVHGGQGTHCHSNAKLVENTPEKADKFYYPDNPKCRDVYVPDGGDVCIMYHQRTNRLHELKFCDTCKKFIRALDLSRSALNKLKYKWDDVY